MLSLHVPLADIIFVSSTRILWGTVFVSLFPRHNPPLHSLSWTGVSCHLPCSHWYISEQTSQRWQYNMERVKMRKDTGQGYFFDNAMLPVCFSKNLLIKTWNAWNCPSFSSRWSPYSPSFLRDVAFSILFPPPRGFADVTVSRLLWCWREPTLSRLSPHEVWVFITELASWQLIHSAGSHQASAQCLQL